MAYAVTLQAAIFAELPFLRGEAESLMVDAGTASRPTGGYAYVDGEEVEATADLFDSPCKIQNRRLVAQEAQVGERTSVTVRTELHLPVVTAPLTVGDVFTVTTPHTLSTVPAGAVYRVTAPVEGSFRTARRYTVERVAS